MTPTENQAGAGTAADLLARRAQLQEWLGRLDDVGTDIPAQVARRVRADYEQRLTAVIAELSAHSESLAGDREQLDERLLAAAERHDAAVDTLEETRLRHRIGEIPAEEWEERRSGLESEVDAAAAERAGIEQEITQLEELLAQIAVDGAAAPAPSDEATLEAGPSMPFELPADETEVAGSASVFAEAAEEWEPLIEEEPAAEPLPVLEAPEPEVAEPEVAEPVAEISALAAEAEPQRTVDDDLMEITNFAAAAEALADEVDPAPTGDDDYAFLEELDRAIAATAPTGESAEEGTEAAGTRPQPGLKCPECGYSNDPAAWYCGVCGVDLG